MQPGWHQTTPELTVSRQALEASEKISTLKFWEFSRKREETMGYQGDSSLLSADFTAVLQLFLVNSPLRTLLFISRVSTVRSWAPLFIIESIPSLQHPTVFSSKPLFKTHSFLWRFPPPKRRLQASWSELWPSGSFLPRTLIPQLVSWSMQGFTCGKPVAGFWPESSGQEPCLFACVVEEWSGFRLKWNECKWKEWSCTIEVK